MRKKLEVDYVSWAGDLGYGLGILAFIFCVIGVFTPAWIDHDLNVEQTLVEFNVASPAISNKSRTIGRGFFQAYEYNGYGLITLVPYLLHDNQGKLDPFCGDRNATSPFPLLQLVEALNIPDRYRGRSYNSGDWCTRKDVGAAFAIISLIFGLAAVIATSLAQKGCCEQTPYIIMIVCVFVSALICTSIMGSYIDEEQNRVNGQSLQSRFFPFEQNIVPGYSFGLYIVGMILYAIAMTLAITERCCCNRDDTSSIKKTESSA
eukprot:m.115663 g.115663  ORF g.115663 m.115663 type:complete len:262 (-) comp15376_c0_seq1:411-1196(-)